MHRHYWANTTLENWGFLWNFKHENIWPPRRSRGWKEGVAAMSSHQREHQRSFTWTHSTCDIHTQQLPFVATFQIKILFFFLLPLRPSQWFVFSPSAGTEFLETMSIFLNRLYTTSKCGTSIWRRDTRWREDRPSPACTTRGQCCSLCVPHWPRTVSLWNWDFQETIEVFFWSDIPLVSHFHTHTARAGPRGSFCFGLILVSEMNGGFSATCSHNCLCARYLPLSTRWRMSSSRSLKSQVFARR